MSLIAWYPLIKDGKNQGLDNTDLTTVGTINYSAGKLGNAPVFNNNLSNRFERSQIKIYDNFSFCCWFKTIGTTNRQVMFFEGRDMNSDGWGLWITNTHKIIYSCGNISYVYPVALSDNVWYHACMTIKNGTWAAYLNGNRVSSGNVTTLPKLTEWGAKFYIACLHPSYYPLNGQIQDVRIYDHPLTQKEVKELSKGLYIHYKLDGVGSNPNLFYPKSPRTSTYTINNPYTLTGKSIDIYINMWNWVEVEEGEFYTLQVQTDKEWANRHGNPESQGYPHTGMALMFIYLSRSVTRPETSFDMAAELNSLGSIQSSIQASYKGNGIWTFKIPSGYHWISFRGNTYSDKVQTVITNFWNFKFEKGLRPTPWIPNVSDDEYALYDMNAVDSSGYGRDALTIGSPQTSSYDIVSKKYVTSTYFDNSGYAFEDTSLKNLLEDSFTCSFWIYPKDKNGISTIYFGCDSFLSFNIEKNTQNKLRVYWAGNLDINVSSFEISDNEWTHVAIVKENSTTMTFYKNGTLNYTYTGNLPNSENYSSQYYLGRDYSDNNGYKGYMSDFRIYASALSADDIKELADVSATVDKDNLFSREFNEINRKTSAHKNGTFETFQLNEYGSSADTEGTTYAQLAISDTNKPVKLGNDYVIAERLAEY